jgi:hypothetical protein
LINSLQQNNKLELAKFQSQVTLEKAIEGTQVSKIKKDNEAGLSKAVKNLIISLAESLNLTNTVNDAQVFEMTLLIIETYWYLKLEELVLIFKNAKIGKYGKMYNRLDIQIICEWIETYLRSEERAMYFEKKNTEHKKKEIDVKLMPELYEKYRMEKEPEEDKDEEYKRQRAEYFRNKIVNEGINDKRK